MYYIASKMIKHLRSGVYASLIRQPIEYFGSKENSTGNLIGMLAKEIRTVNPVSVDMYVLILQGFVGMLTGVAIALAYSWKIGLAALAFCPFSILMSILQARENNIEKKNLSAHSKHERVLISDTIVNHSTISSLANESVIVDRYFKERDSMIEEFSSTLFSFI